MALSILLADEDERYLVPLELKFTEEFGEKAEILVITDKEYLKEYFSEPQNIDVLIINKDLYDENYERQNINNIFILCEEDESSATDNINYRKIYKYTSVKHIYNNIISNMSSQTLRNIESSESKGTELIMVYSPIGGAGSTLSSLGIAGALSQCKKKVLYISTEILQSHNCYLQNKNYIMNNFEKDICDESSDIFEKLKGLINREIFDYLPPFRQAISSYNITLSNYFYLFDAIKKAGVYDYIIIDTSSELSIDKTRLMSICEKVIIVSMQDEHSTMKIERMLDTIDCSNKNKFMLICNKYNTSEVNYLIKNPYTSSMLVSEYITKMNNDEINIERLSNDKQYQKIAYKII